jgi:hypothetical protein
MQVITAEADAPLIWLVGLGHPLRQGDLETQAGFLAAVHGNARR